MMAVCSVGSFGITVRANTHSRAASWVCSCDFSADSASQALDAASSAAWQSRQQSAQQLCSCETWRGPKTEHGHAVAWSLYQIKGLLGGVHLGLLRRSRLLPQPRAQRRHLRRIDALLNTKHDDVWTRLSKQRHGRPKAGGEGGRQMVLGQSLTPCRQRPPWRSRSAARRRAQPAVPQPRSP